MSSDTWSPKRGLSLGDVHAALLRPQLGMAVGLAADGVRGDRRGRQVRLDVVGAGGIVWHERQPSYFAHILVCDRPGSGAEDLAAAVRDGVVACRGSPAWRPARGEHLRGSAYVAPRGSRARRSVGVVARHPVDMKPPLLVTDEVDALAVHVVVASTSLMSAVSTRSRRRWCRDPGSTRRSRSRTGCRARPVPSGRRLASRGVGAGVRFKERLDAPVAR